MIDVLKAIRASSRLEDILRKKYGADESGLGTQVRSLEDKGKLRPDIIELIKYVAEVRNEMAHNNVNRLPDEKRFSDTCVLLENFFKRKILIDVNEEGPAWSSTFSISWWPKSLISSREKRLFYHAAGDTKVCPVGSYRLTTLRGIKETGYVCMIPQSLPEMEIEPLVSKDKLSFSMVLSLSAVIADIPEKIRRMIFDADEQLEKFRRQILLTLQGICVNNDYDELLHSRHAVAEELKSLVNSKVKSDEVASFLISECAITECELEDNEINAMRRNHLRAAEGAKKREEELKRLADIEKLQLLTMKEKTDLENQLALVMKEHELKVLNLNAEADTALIKRKAGVERELALVASRQEIEIQQNKANVERELALVASRQEIEIQQNKAKADIETLNVVKAKAELAATPHGKHALYPDDSFDVEKRKLNLEFEYWKAKFSDRKIQQILGLVGQAGLNQTQLDTLRETLRQQFNVALNERPLALQENSEPKAAPSSQSNNPNNT